MGQDSESKRLGRIVIFEWITVSIIDCVIYTIGNVLGSYAPGLVLAGDSVASTATYVPVLILF